MQSRMRLSLLLLVALALVARNVVVGHVALTFPKARQYDLDFLDNARTPGPCGMPKGDIKTSLLSGSSFNVTWHLAYPHRGGFKIQILDALDRPLVDLTPVTKQSEFVETDATAQGYPVELPANFTCTDCTIRLLREAEEWGSTYRFWSCADVDIVEKKSYREDCSGHGRSVLGRCRCDRFYHGPRCQYREECLDDSDCGTQGVCVDNGGTTAPTKHCYCNIGWFGPGCSKRSVMKNVDLDLQSYTMKRFSDDFTFYWRILKDSREFEGVAVVNGTSWVGVGWRPSSLTSACRAVPEIRERGKKGSPEPLPRPEPKESPSAEPEHEPSAAEPEPPSPEHEPSAAEPEPSSSEPEPSTEPSTGRATNKALNNKRSAKHEAGVTPQPGGDVTVQTSVTYRVSTKQGRKKRSPQPDPQPTGEPVSEPPKSQHEPIPKNEPTSKHEPVPENEPTSEHEPTPENEPTSEHEPVPENEPTSEHEPAPENEPTSEHEPTSKHEPRPKSEPKSHHEPIPKNEPTSKHEPVPENEPTSEHEPAPENESTSEHEPTSKHESIPKSEPKSHHEPVPKNEPTAKHEPVPENEPTSEHEPAPENEPTSEHEPSPEKEPTSEHEPTPENEPTSEHEPTPEKEPTSEHEPIPENEPTSKHNDPKSEPHSEDSKQQSNNAKSGTTKAGHSAVGLHKYTPKHDFNPMDCTDIIIGSARGMKHRIGDYYTRDRSTPHPDYFWGGKDSLTAAMGFERDGVTTILFRRKLASDEHFSDHEIADTAMQVIWAKGQEPGKYIHVPASGVEHSKVSVKDFYKADELKYHGHKSQRGVTTINFFEEKGREDFGGGVTMEGGGCGGEWRYPRNCSPENYTCEYSIKWLYKSRNEEIAFTIVTKNIDTWTGIAFSKDEKMSHTDAILGWVDKTSGRAFLMDTWISGYNSPVLDPQQDIFNFSGRIENGETTLKFTRKRDTGDSRDLAFNDDQCLYFMFPVKGGTFNPVNKKIRKHETVPIVSAQKVCIKSCGIEEEDDATTPAPPRLFYDVEVRLVNLGDGYKAPLPGSPDFEDISNTISGSFSPTLEKVPGFHQLKLSELRKNGNNGVIAKMNLAIDRNEIKGRALRPQDTAAMAEAALMEALVTGKVGALTVDPQYLVLRSHTQNDLDENDLDKEGSENSLMAGLLLGDSKLYAVIVCAIALLALVLLQASCTVYKASKKRTTKDRLIAKNAWRDYSSSANTNFAFEAFETEEKSPPPPVSSLSRVREMTMTNGHSAVDGHHHKPMQMQMQQTPSHRHSASSQMMQMQMGPRATYSLPRAPGPRQSPGMSSAGGPQGYYTQDRRNMARYNGGGSSSNGKGLNGNYQPHHHHHHSGTLPQQTQPDFYFMPSQRKYSGEVVRVYVDYGNQQQQQHQQQKHK